MNSTGWTICKATILAAVLVILIGCNYNGQSAGNQMLKEPAKRSAWLAYWDLEAGAKDLARIGKKLDQLSYFGAYFAKDDTLFLPRELSAQKSELQAKQRGYETYLTFVNDLHKADGSVVMKDTEVLRRVFADEAAMEKHIDEIIAMTLQAGFDGIEIDYERVWKEAEAGQLFLTFAEKLYVKALNNNLKLRLVLEPGTPFAATRFPRGPEYVVMAYNLYGMHSGPGPKANKEFIQKTAALMQTLPGEKSLALSTGGCLWSDNGEKRFLTEIEAKTLAAVYEAEPLRDDESQCLVYSYQDNGISYQVWYADVKTLNYWLAVAQEQGINNISLWRLGGNVAVNKLK
ncbi:glycosyl hydrolase family 18 protein [Sporomusa termitida]|uniref:GH18 domain-containing protein n=1 Tax=Sporomusa termitida TaxID=2377 RepID=A0A517DQU0_9FIRM|nr:glycosyl hydrolase family 18 protein [Sporomusa termitida]QDR79732.1 hypothetical protein SPTER_10270 [Sporomusa termitida]